MKKKRRLKKWVRVTLSILLTITIAIILAFIFMKGVNDWEKLAKQCDEDRGYTCSYYDVRQYSLSK